MSIFANLAIRTKVLVASAVVLIATVGLGGFAIQRLAAVNSHAAEISRNVRQASDGTSQVAGNIVEVNHDATESGLTSSQALASAQSFAREITHLKTEAQKLLQMVRVA